MGMFIELSSAEVKVFLNHVDHASRLGRRLVHSEVERVSIPGPMNVIHCSRDETLWLLEIATTECPTAIKRIRQGLIDQRTT